MKRVFFQFTAFIFVVLQFAGCSDPFSFSPFEAAVSDDVKDLTKKNLDRIHQGDTLTSPTFKVALLSDSHYHFNSLADAIGDINRKKEYSFIIVTGDITENGLLKEFEIFQKIMSKANIPYLTVIGNHDYLSNGGEVYRQMYGAYNYSFTFHHVKFVAWDNVIWESRREADYEWLEEALHEETDSTTPSLWHTIPFSHIPPFDGQLKENQEKFRELLNENDIHLSVHGHKHEFFYGKLYDDEIDFLTVGSPQHRGYAELIISPEGIVVEKIAY